ncbi:hypothetical protein [Amycolatopsis anabasis]|uniref:hypothetical protein n=1 Tax=Amycolatopsis anabasis TaxID=1840409 RepID=UPI00131C7048|nr:hypothetical protein [Amycolatopsis anabasis]
MDATALRLLVRYLFATTTLDRAEVGVEVDDPARRHVVVTAGFRREGVLRGARMRATSSLRFPRRDGSRNLRHRLRLVNLLESQALLDWVSGRRPGWLSYAHDPVRVVSGDQLPYFDARRFRFGSHLQRCRIREFEKGGTVMEFEIEIVENDASLLDHPSG